MPPIIHSRKGCKELPLKRPCSFITRAQRDCLASRYNYLFATFTLLSSLSPEIRANWWAKFLRRDRRLQFRSKVQSVYFFLSFSRRLMTSSASAIAMRDAFCVIEELFRAVRQFYIKQSRCGSLTWKIIRVRCGTLSSDLQFRAGNDG